MEGLLAQLVNGIALGSIYSLLVTGFNLLLLVGGIIPFVYPFVVVICMYMTWAVMGATGENLFVAIPSTILSATVLTVAMEPLFRPLVKRRAEAQTFVMAVGLSMILTHIMSLHLNHGFPVSFPARLVGREAAIKLGLVVVSKGQLLTFLGTIAAVVALMYLLYRTMPGRAFRSMAQSPFVARLLGIPLNRSAVASYGVAGFLGGCTAIFLAMALGTAYPILGEHLALKALAVALFAGMGNLRGGLICGLILGMAEGLATGYIAGLWSNAVAFGMIMVVVILRPKGLFGVKF
jgi:branched-subunit amino acid ABC-type transport system permease component